MSIQESLKQIPIREEHAPGAKWLHPARRAMQVFTIIVLIAIPASGLFRIDPAVGGFILLDRQIWFSDMFIVMGLWILLASLLILMYSAVGSVFCGWACPQNTVSEWANKMTEKLLGRRANMMDMSGAKMKVATRRKSWLNYTILGLLLLGASMFYALIPMFYFYPPDVIWSFVTFQEDERLASSLHWIYFVCVAVMLVDIAVMRHLICKYMCIYRVWQHSFKTRDTLHISYDKSRSNHCTNCNYCVDSCFLDIDPRKPEVFDSCVNCGACVVACDELHSKSKKYAGPGLLHLMMGDENKKKYRGNVGSFFARAKTAVMGTVIGALMFGFGLLSYDTASFSVYRGEAWQGQQVLDYRVNIAYKMYKPVDMRIEIKGLKPEHYQLAQQYVHFDTAGRQDVDLHIRKDLPKGLYRFKVRVVADDGWENTFNVVHYAGDVQKGGI